MNIREIMDQTGFENSTQAVRTENVLIRTCEATSVEIKRIMGFVLADPQRAVLALHNLNHDVIDIRRKF